MLESAENIIDKILEPSAQFGGAIAPPPILMSSKSEPVEVIFLGKCSWMGSSITTD